MAEELIFKRQDKYHFFTKTKNGFEIHTDSKVGNGYEQTAATPMNHLLAGLAGCTGIDVVMILEKMHVELDDFQIRLQYDRKETHPKIYTNIKIIYEFTGKDLPMDKLEKAVNLSQNKYCSASAIFKESAEVTHEIIIKEA
ncbi:osmotically inducible protein C [Tepiditoga spiralis]|uniref:Osmotically inducible protein C n=1 Tax=Tepiditoga spiralis TaxID=2108365 RepID=A0A7G1G777_9BACT|nr:OsmC family protein [Tepiditoga spiralis]BBE29872.1 osmotically inducible protein C [Tepiditoga spiralis]